jgi:hypothetical protein
MKKITSSSRGDYFLLFEVFLLVVFLAEDFFLEELFFLVAIVISPHCTVYQSGYD